MTFTAVPLSFSRDIVPAVRRRITSECRRGIIRPYPAVLVDVLHELAEERNVSRAQAGPTGADA